MPDNDLDVIERWMQAVIMHPEGVESGIISERAQNHLSLPPDQIERVVTRSQALSAIERLGIYANAYHARLLECLREEFPALLHALGGEAFDEVAVNYLRECPSTSYTLAELGARFPGFLARSLPIAVTEVDQESKEYQLWISFMVELAEVERLYSEVFDGPGVEGQSLWKPESVASMSSEVWQQARLLPVGCLRILKLRFPVHDYITAVRNKENPPLPQPADTYLAVTRRNYVIRRIPLSRPQFELLSALIEGAPIGEAIRQFATSFAGGDDALAASLRNWFSDWAAAGFFQGLSFA